MVRISYIEKGYEPIGNIGAYLIIRIRFWSELYSNYDKEPHKSISNYPPQ